MAKDGTNRGGARVGAGRKSKALVEKINAGTSAQILYSGSVVKTQI